MIILARFLAFLLFVIAAPVSAKLISFDQFFDNGAGRLVPISVTGKAGKAKGVILFSHGAFSSPAKYAEITHKWADAGYLVIAPLHADSSDWAGMKPEQKDQTAWRLADMKLAYTQLDGLAAKAGVTIKRAKIVAAGHSFGALIALMDEDPRVTSVIAFSPPGPLPGLSIPVVSKPLLTITGTADQHPLMAPQWQAHLAAHKAATGPAWAYVGEGADHYYGGIFCRPELPGPKATAAFADAMALSLQFLKRPGRVARLRVKAGTLQSGHTLH